MTAETDEGPARRSRLTAEIVEQTGIDEALIGKLVHTFYASIREDALLGPIFEAQVEDWDKHLDRMCAFWSSVTLMTGRYHGQPMRAHAPLGISGAHFDNWLALFSATAKDVCTATAADHFIERAHKIAQSLELGIAMQRGVSLKPGERLEALKSTAADPAGRITSA